MTSLRSSTWICAAALALAGGCGDDTSSADGSGTDSGSTSGPTTSTPTASATTPVTGSMTAAETLSSSTDDTAASTGSGSSGSGSTSDTDTNADTGTSGTDSSGSDSGSTTGTTNEVCKMGGEFVLNWGLEVIGGQFPDDLPDDLTASCTLGMATMPGQLRVECPGLQFFVNIESTPAVSLPDSGETFELRFHKAPSALGFPDLWLQLDFDSGLELALGASSVLDPNTATLDLPLDLAESNQSCGPFNIEGPFGNPDPCGDQEWLGLEVSVEDETLLGYNGSYQDLESGDTTVAFWVGSAREYLSLPKTCDISPAFYTVMTTATTDAPPPPPPSSK